MRTTVTAWMTLLIAGCGRDDAIPIDETRVLADPRPEQTMVLDTRARMGLGRRGGGSVHPPMDGGAPAAPAPAASSGPEANALSWTAPESWTQGPAKQMRVVTFVPDGAPGVECYVTVLGGGAGGVEANVNRWRGQLNLAPLSADALATLPTLDVLGRSAPWVEIDGGELGMYGLVCELGARTIFVKMTGRMDVLRAERERFLAFCRSLS